MNTTQHPETILEHRVCRIVREVIANLRGRQYEVGKCWCGHAPVGVRSFTGTVRCATYERDAWDDIVDCPCKNDAHAAQVVTRLEDRPEVFSLFDPDL